MTFADWFIRRYSPAKSFHRKAESEHTWWRVIWLTRADCSSTVAHQPSIAFLTGGVLPPVATLILGLVTLCGALPVYSHVAEASPNGPGSVGILQKFFAMERQDLCADSIVKTTGSEGATQSRFPIALE